MEPAFLGGVVGREDRRAALAVACASPGGTRPGLVTVIGWADHGVAPPAPSRHAIAPSRPWTTVIPWGERRVELARRHRSVARREPSGVARGAHHSRLPSRTGTKADRSESGVTGAGQDLTSGQPLRGPGDPKPGHADRAGNPVGQLEELDRDATVIMLRDTKDLSVLGSIDAGLCHEPSGYPFCVPPGAETPCMLVRRRIGAGYSSEMTAEPTNVDLLAEPIEGWRTWNLSVDKSSGPLPSSGPAKPRRLVARAAAEGQMHGLADPVAVPPAT